MAQRVTIKDVARVADVSIRTVSNVINNKGRMRPETRAHVQQVIDDLGYTVNPTAQSLKRGVSDVIGIALPSGRVRFFFRAIEPIIAAARTRGFSVVISTYEDVPGGLEAIAPAARKTGAAGWFYYIIHELEDGGAVLDQDWPVVLWGDYLTYGHADQVAVPYTGVFDAMTDRLIESGRRTIAMVGAPERWRIDRWEEPRQGGSRPRFAGYKHALERHGLEVNLDLVECDVPWNRRTGLRAVARMLDEGLRPDAFVCSTDAVAFGVMHELERRGLRVPDDIAVTGFGNTEESSYSSPTLTTIETNVADQAAEAVDLLISRINGDTSPWRVLQGHCEIVERESSGTLATPGQ